MAPVVVAVCADLHSNSKTGLCPPRVADDDGGTYHANPGQRWLWDRWVEFWTSVSALARDCAAERTIAVVDGDVVDRNRHSAYQLIGQNVATIVTIGEQVMEPVTGAVQDIYIVRGTEAHVGGAGEIEELLAHRLDAEGPRQGIYSWWSLCNEWGGVRFDIAHHPATNSTRPWLRGSAAGRQSAILMDAYAGRRMPHIAVRAHVHHFEDSGLNYPIRSMFLPSWTCSGGAFEARIGLAGQHPQVGGLVFVCDGRYQVERYEYRPKG